MSQDLPPVVVDDWRSYPPLDLPPILESALAEIVAHGYAATSVRRIAERVGVTVPALYYHFENKQAILSALVDRAMQVVLTHAYRALETAGEDRVERLRVLVEAVALYIAHHPDLAFISTERRSLVGGNLERYVARRDELEGLLRTAVAEGVDEGVFATPHPRESVRAMLAMCQGIANWYRPDGTVPPQDMALRYVDLALAMVQRRSLAERSAP